MLVAASAVAGVIIGYFLRPVVASEGVDLPARWPIPELLVAGLFTLAAIEWDGWRLGAVAVFIVTVVALAIVDLDDYRLPNAVLFPGLIASAVVLALGELIDGDTQHLTAAAVGAGAYFAVLFVLHVVNPAGMGFGDVKLALLLGMFVGWVAESRLDAVRAIMIALLIGSFGGVILGVGRIAAFRVGARFLPDPEEGSAGAGWHRTTFPFGPPLIVGALLVVLFPGWLIG